MRTLVLSGVLAIGVLAAGALPASADIPPLGGHLITLYEVQKGSTFGFVDNAPKTTMGKNGEPKFLSAGDQVSFSSPVQNAAHKPAGRVSATCTVTRAGSSRTELEVCTGAIRLRGGDLLLAATLKGQPKRLAIAVVGGTGTYTGARGLMVSNTTQTGSTDFIQLQP
jgi:hypothetical protein